MRGQIFNRTVAALALAVALGMILLGAASGVSVLPTNTWIDLYSSSSTYLGQPVPPGASVAVYDPQGVQCGGFVVTQAGAYGIMPCYGDDPETPLVDEGAVLNDPLLFTINGATARTEVVSIDTTNVPSTTIVAWGPAQSLWRVNLHARLNVTDHALASSANPANLGESVSVTATVTGAGPGGEQPTGAVQFRADGTLVGGPVALTGGSATVHLPALAAGVHAITAEYSGDAVFYPSTANLLQEVRPYEEQCGLTVASQHFNAGGPLLVNIATLGTLDCLRIQPMIGNHPYATVGIATGQYWLITGLDHQGGPADGFNLTLTISVPFIPDANDKLCRYTGVAQIWDCAASGFDPVNFTITRSGIVAFSDWAVGNNVGSNAVTISELRASSPGRWRGADLLFAGLLGLAAAGVLFYSRARCR
jgi:hypothetical protein